MDNRPWGLRGSPDINVDHLTVLIATSFGHDLMSKLLNFFNDNLSLSVCRRQAFPICGLYYKHMMIVNYANSVVNKLEALLTDDARVLIYDRHVFIVQATGVMFAAKARTLTKSGTLERFFTWVVCLPASIILSWKDLLIWSLCQ